MKPQKPKDVYVVNGWYLDIPVSGISTDGHFETLEGIGKSTGVVEVVDAGSNTKYKFSDQLVDYSEMTLTRPYDGSSTDRAMEALVNTMIENGLRVPVKAIKMHHGQEVLTIIFEGFAFSAVKYPTLDVGGSEKFTVTYTAHCDGFTILPAGV